MPAAAAVPAPVAARHDAVGAGGPGARPVGAAAAPSGAAASAHVSGGYDDLQRVSERELAFAKARMTAAFEANRVRRGEPGYVHDVQKEFEPPAGGSEWDSDED